MESHMSVAKPIGMARKLASLASKERRAALVRRVAKRLQRQDDAEDVVQEAILRLLNMKPDQSVKEELAYLNGVVDHAASDWEELERNRVLDGWDAVEAWAGQSGNAQQDDIAEHLDRKQQVERAWAQLSPREREALQASREGVTRAEIARRMEIDIGSVDRCIHRAKARMREFLGQLRDQS
jgi:RNA polymerase sigma factor (sigma-70 family)